MAGDGTLDVLAIRFGGRVSTRGETFLNYHVYGEPDAPLDVAYYFWVIRGPQGVILVDTGFAPEAGRRRGRDSAGTPERILPGLGIDPAAIRTVVVTHAHWDHIGNLHQFPEAEIVISQAEYDFWTGPYASRTQFAAHSEAEEIIRLRDARKQDRLTFVTGRHSLTPDVELIEVGGHTPGELVVTVAAGGGTVVLASDAMHFYEEAERDRPFSILTDLPGMYRAYDVLRDLAAQPRTWLVAGHDPEVEARFAPHPSVPGVTDLAAPRA